MNTINMQRPWIIGMFVLAISYLLLACSGSVASELAKVNEVEVVTSPGNPPSYFAVASGLLPDGCTELGRASQQVVATTIKVALPIQSEGGTCSQLESVRFRETVRLRVDGLSAGSYTVEVNGTVASFILTEDH